MMPISNQNRLLTRVGWVLLPLLGFLLTELPGAAGGLLLAYAADQRLRVRPHLLLTWKGCGLSREEQLFGGILFSTLGHLAKSDGRVSESEISATRSVMAELGLKGDGRKQAIALFQAGKVGDFPLRAVVRRLRRGVSVERREDFMDYLLRIAYADGPAVPAEQEILRVASREIGLARVRLEDMMHRRNHRSRPSRSVRPSLDSAYRMLEVAETASVEEIKRAYRRAISRHHPDRLVAKGLPDGEVQAATRRTHEVRSAFEAIRRVRGF